jgi:hypothetical protein
MRPEGLGNLIKIIHLIGSRTFWDMTSCNLVERANVSEEPAVSVFLSSENGDKFLRNTRNLTRNELGDILDFHFRVDLKIH